MLIKNNYKKFSMNTNVVLIDLGSHTVKIGTVQTEESSEDLFHVS